MLMNLPYWLQPIHELCGFPCQEMVPGPAYQILRLIPIDLTIHNTWSLIPFITIDLNCELQATVVPSMGIINYRIRNWNRLYSMNLDWCRDLWFEVCREIWWVTVKGPSSVQTSVRVGLVDPMCHATNSTWDPFWIFGSRICPWIASSSCDTWLCLISTWRWSWIWCIVAWTWSASRHRRWCSSDVSSENNICGSVPWVAENRVHFVISDIALFSAHSGIGHHCNQSPCSSFTDTQRYCPILAFIGSVWLCDCG